MSVLLVERDRATAGNDRATLDRMRGLCRDGAGLPLAEGLALEVRVFAEHIAAVTPETVARSRDAVPTRGRSLAKPGRA